MMAPEEFIRLAGKLAAPLQGDEAQYRTAISRAYYGAFHLVCEYLRSVGLRVQHNHGAPVRWLQESGDPRAVVAGRSLADLQSWRVAADYD